MAKRPSVKEILEAARRGGAVTAPAPDAGDLSTAPDESPETPAVAPAMTADSAPTAPTVQAPTPESLGRPLTLKEKLAAARAGATAAPAPAKAVTLPPAGEEVVIEPVRSVPAPAAPLGRPLSLAEKLAAARGGASAPAAGGAAKPATASAKPATAAKAASAKRELPPLDKITDPKDLAEALRQTGARKVKEVEAAQAKANPAAAKAVREKETKPSTVLPKPSKGSALATASVQQRRAFLSITALIWIGWGAFTLGVLQFTAMLGRFMFPNVLAEPPSTIKIGLPSNFDPEAVNERFKAEWGFWVVRSTRLNGDDIIYALQSVCTHLGCPPNWLTGEQKFKCPCHGSGFYISGVNFEGPAPRPLERFKLIPADDGQLVVDKSQKYQQELGQWSDPESFVKA